MTIETWAGLWRVVLISCVGLYALMTLIVSVGAIKDARALYRDLRPKDPGPGPGRPDGSDSGS